MGRLWQSHGVSGEGRMIQKSIPKGVRALRSDRALQMNSCATIGKGWYWRKADDLAYWDAKPSQSDWKTNGFLVCFKVSIPSGSNYQYSR